MDNLLKIRLAIWVMVLALWGILVYQFLGEDNPLEEGRMQWVSNPFPKPSAVHRPTPPETSAIRPHSPRPIVPSEETIEAVPSPEAETASTQESSSETGAASAVPVSEEATLASKMPTTPLPAPWESARTLATAPPPGHFIVPLQPKSKNTKPFLAKPHATEGSLRRHEYAPVQEPSAPGGFVKIQTAHFFIFSEGDAPPERFLDTLESLHANLMLDLAAFSPWAHDEKVFVYLFRNQDSYRRVTGRPAWSGGASSVSKRKIYLYESDELMGILAHEMCHIYFDSFFSGGKTDPLWLSEGMATLVQVERGLSSPNWLPENLDILYRGGGFSLADFMRVDNTAGANDDNVRLWYTQSYSIVRFLIRAHWKSSFYHFCGFLRDGVPVQEALYRAYGMPFNRVKALEYAWRYDLETHRIIRLQTAAP